jgi:pseudaminic acid cytidylyltransferase
MKILAILPAREKSKRIKNKNLLKIRNKSILQINLNNLRKMKIFDKIIISTESKKIKKLAKKIKFDYIVDRPLIKKTDLIKAKRILKKKDEIVFASLKYSHPIQRAFRIVKNHKIKYFLNEKQIFKNTQSYNASYHDAGQFYIGHKKAWKNYRKSKKKSLVISNSNAVDVDNYDDFKLLKMIYDFSKK